MSGTGGSHSASGLQPASESTVTSTVTPSSSQTLAVNSRGTGTVTARRNRTAGARANGLSRHRVGGRGWRRAVTVTATCANTAKPAMAAMLHLMNQFRPVRQ